ncbi:hypothetical protein HAX54_013660 [Datura stramonium]|uniref:Uncharacterized protein n=1 Tax=Datura stramonium TaxID=4076 RepID=A0ABS8TNC9_DATST|nr:hypothetical protein [Datura stramonium]
MGSSGGAGNTVQDFIITFDSDSDGSDSPKIHGLTSVDETESFLSSVEFNQEVDQKDITSHSIKTSQLVTSNTDQDFIIKSDFDGGDSLKTHELTSVAETESFLPSVEFGQEIDPKDVTTHSIQTSQHVASPPRTSEEKRISSAAPMKGTIIPGRSRTSKPPYRALKMRAVNDYGVLKEKRERSTKRRKSTP